MLGPLEGFEYTPQDLILSAVVSLLAAGIILWDAGRVGRSRWWAILGLLGGGFGLLAWLLWRTFGPQPAGARPPAPAAEAAGADAAAAAPLKGVPQPAQPPRKCPECKTLDVGEFSFCKRCGADLPA